jgi:hypothetical protein
MDGDGSPDVNDTSAAEGVNTGRTAGADHDDVDSFRSARVLSTTRTRPVDVRC